MRGKRKDHDALDEPLLELQFRKLDVITLFV